MSEEKKQHVHCHLMALYAQDAMETDKPWERWECDGSGSWCSIETHPIWCNTSNYRRKQKKIRIGEYDVPEPLRVEPKMNEAYCLVNVLAGFVSDYSWDGDISDNKWLQLGLIHLTKQAAQTHLDALLSFTKTNG